MERDARGVPVSCPDRSALDLYEKALVQYQSYVGDPIATIDEALTRAPAFVVGHVFRATLLMTLTERRFAEQARGSVASAEALLAHASPREQGLVAAARRLVDGDWDAACAAFDRVLVDHPRDAFAIQSAHLMDFYRGDALNLRNRVSRVLPHWSPGVPGYSYILGMHAFGLEECNQYPQAEEAGRRALALQPKDGWAVHAVTHVMEMQGRIDDGIEWLESREGDWAPDNGFAFHNYWHLALYYLHYPADPPPGRRRATPARAPPSTLRSAPVVKDDSSDATPPCVRSSSPCAWLAHRRGPPITTVVHCPGRPAAPSFRVVSNRMPRGGHRCDGH